MHLLSCAIALTVSLNQGREYEDDDWRTGGARHQQRMVSVKGSRHVAAFYALHLARELCFFAMPLPPSTHEVHTHNTHTTHTTQPQVDPRLKRMRVGGQGAMARPPAGAMGPPGRPVAPRAGGSGAPHLWVQADDDLLCALVGGAQCLQSTYCSVLYLEIFAHVLQLYADYAANSAR